MWGEGGGGGVHMLTDEKSVDKNRICADVCLLGATCLFQAFELCLRTNLTTSRCCL